MGNFTLSRTCLKKTVNVNTSHVKSPVRSTRSLFLSKFSRRSQTFIFSLWQINITLHRFQPSYIPSSLLVWPFDLVPCFNSMANLQVIASNLQGLWTIRTIDRRSKNRKLSASEVGGALSSTSLISSRDTTNQKSRREVNRQRYEQALNKRKWAIVSHRLNKLIRKR